MPQSRLRRTESPRQWSAKAPVSASPPTAAHSRGAYRRTEVRDLYGASLHAIDAAVRSGEIRANKRGRTVFLHPADVERIFGFDEPPMEVSQESVAEMEDFLAS